MSFDGIRLKWRGDLNNLKQVIHEVLGLEGKCRAVGRSIIGGGGGEGGGSYSYILVHRL